jgi:anaerobic sulfite reductase subunit C
MSLDLNRKSVTKNAWRITKERDKGAVRIRVPGGHMKTEHFALINQIATQYGNGTVHMTTRQGFELPGIDFANIDTVNRMLRPILDDLEIAIGVVGFDKPEKGYPSAGTRNVAACIGNRVCPFGNYDTTALAQRIEKEIYPNNFHVKIALAGCPNDCIKSRMHDFGIIGMAEPQLDITRCMGCEACVTNCKKSVTGALQLHKNRVVRDERRCIGCGECVLKCPTAAWTRNPQKFFNLIIMGRTGKKNPRIAENFIQWATEDVVVQVIKNTYGYIDKYIDRSLAKEHIGYIVDRTGYHNFKDFVLAGIELNPEARVAQHIQWGGTLYVSDIFAGDS